MDYDNKYINAQKYAKTVRGMAANGKIDNETLYHILCLSVENLASALAAKLNYIPEDSELSSIFFELKLKLTLPESFLTEVQFLNQFMTYCSLEFEKPKKITDADKMRMISFMNDLEIFTEEILKS